MPAALPCRKMPLLVLLAFIQFAHAEQPVAHRIKATRMIAGETYEAWGTCWAAKVKRKGKAKGSIVMTCAHTLKDRTRFEVEVGAGWVDAKLLAIDHEQDIAMLWVDADMKPLELRPSGEMTVHGAEFGDPVVKKTGAVKRIELSVPVYEGASGGPVVDPEGKVRGMLAARMVNAEGITVGCLLIAADRLLAFIEKHADTLKKF
ncbi:MAG: trypsin-like peptidase domain-containing protein [Planctomycetes bacterium]|nr:trypsin-like peptidase domain-containing protein [Planctomycetota bacterium]